MQTLIFYCANKVGFTLDFTKTSGDPTELPSPSLGTSLQEQLIAPNRTESSLGCTYDLRPYCWLYQGRPRPPKELVFGGVIIVKDGEKEVLFIDIKKIRCKIGKNCSKVIE